MAEHAPLTKQMRERVHTRIHTNVERALAEYDDDDWADMCMRGLGYILRYEATVVALEAELARLRPLAEVGEAVEGMPAGYALHHYDDASWLVRESNLSGWEKLPFPPTVTGAMKKAAEEYSYDPTWDAALRAAKGDGDA